MCKRYSGKEGILKIDFKHARGVFEDYLNGYDREDEKIKLKIIHTYGVVKSAREIGHRMHLNEEDQQLAELIALLHDIGRFQQLRLYNSFSPDTMDHAAFGVQLLFEGENPMISRFIDSLFRKTPGMILFAPQLPDTVISGWKEFRTKELFSTQK